MVFSSFYERLSIKKDGKKAKACNKKNDVYSHSVHKCFELISEEEYIKLRESVSNYHRLLMGKREDINYRWSKRNSLLCVMWLVSEPKYLWLPVWRHFHSKGTIQLSDSRNSDISILTVSLNRRRGPRKRIDCSTELNIQENVYCVKQNTVKYVLDFYSNIE